MYDTTANLISRLLRDTVAELDLPASLRQAATSEYERVGRWLCENSDGGAGWRVYPQGSFLLNTVVLPTGRDEYDLDAVCLRELEKEATTQAKLKYEVGDSLAGYVAAHRGLGDGPTDRKECKRCWKLRYPSSLHFHLDVLPGIPNRENPPTGILITDRELREWQRSNPLAFAEWFKQQAAVEFLAKRLRLAEAARTEPQAIPDWEVMTTLHRVVQVLKLHRNEFFRDDPDSRPVSILVTTLAAHAYRGEQELYDAVLQTVELMPQYVQESASGPVVSNPVEPRENFADRWRERPELASRFYGWLEQLGDDLRDAESRRGLDNVALRLSESFGERPVKQAFGHLGDGYRATRESGRLRFGATTGLLSPAAGIPVRNHDFYGDGG
jgi:ribosomal protein L39E